MELFRRSTRIDVREVEIVLLTRIGGVAEHRADLAAVFHAADGAIRVAGTRTLRCRGAHAHLHATAGGGRTVVIHLAGQARRKLALFLHAAERFAVFETRVIHGLRLAVAPIDDHLAQRHLVMRGPCVKAERGLVLTAAGHDRAFGQAIERDRIEQRDRTLARDGCAPNSILR